MNQKRIGGLLRCRAKRPRTTKPILIQDTGGKSHGCGWKASEADLGRAAACHRHLTEGEAIPSDLAAAVSSGSSTQASEESPNAKSDRRTSNSLGRTCAKPIR